MKITAIYVDPDRMMRVLNWAAALPSPLPDPKAGGKLITELGEFKEALRNDDYIGAATELADIVCYAVKIIHAKAAQMGLSVTHASEKKEFVASVIFMMSVINSRASQLGLSVEQAFDVCDAKYALRARPGNPKDDAAERAAIMRIPAVKAVLMELAEVDA